MILFFIFFPALRILKCLPHVKVSTARAFFEPHIPTESLIVGNYEVPCDTCPRVALLSLGSYPECTPGTSWIVVHPAGAGVVEDLHEDRVLQV